MVGLWLDMVGKPAIKTIIITLIVTITIITIKTKIVNTIIDDNTNNTKNNEHKNDTNNATGLKTARTTPVQLCTSATEAAKRCRPGDPRDGQNDPTKTLRT